MKPGYLLCYAVTDKRKKPNIVLSVTLMYKGADKSLAQPARKQANVSVRMAWISFGALPCRGRNLMAARVSMSLKSRASLTCFRPCFLRGRAKDLSAPGIMRGERILCLTKWELSYVRGEITRSFNSVYHLANRNIPEDFIFRNIIATTSNLASLCYV